MYMDFHIKNLSITNAVIKTVKLPCVEVNITENLKKEIFIDNCDKFLIIDSCKLSEYVNNEIDSNCTNYLDLDLNYNCSTSTCPTCNTVCSTPCTILLSSINMYYTFILLPCTDPLCCNNL